MAHAANCSVSWGVQLATTPDFTSADFVPALHCTDFTRSESTLTLAISVLLKGLVAGTKYFYVAGSPELRDPWSRVYSFTHDTGAARAEGVTSVVLADFGYYNAESLDKLMADAYEGRFDALLHAGDFACGLGSRVRRASSIGAALRVCIVRGPALSHARALNAPARQMTWTATSGASATATFGSSSLSSVPNLITVSAATTKALKTTLITKLASQASQTTRVRARAAARTCSTASIRGSCTM